MKEETKEKDLKLEQLELEMLEMRAQLEAANQRAIKAEEELHKHKITVDTQEDNSFKCPAPKPPPLPPPMPSTLKQSSSTASLQSLSDAISQTKLQPAETQCQKPQGKWIFSVKIVTI